MATKTRTDEVVARFRPTLLPKLDALVRAAALADTYAHHVFDWPNDSAVLDLRDSVGDAVMCMREDVDDSSRPELRFARLGFDPVRVARQMLELSVDRTDYVDRDRPLGYVESLEQVARARHALIVYAQRIRLPRLEGLSQYIGGLVSGVALLVDLDAMAFRGGVEFGAGSSWEVKSKEALVDHTLVDDLSRHFGDALLVKVAQRFPDAKLPVTLGY